MGDEELKAGILEDVKRKGVEFITLQFVDMMGIAKNCEVPVSRLEDSLNIGFWFDGSSIDGFARIHESDMFLKPDVKTYATLPWTNNKVARIICDVYLDEKRPFEGDPRYVLRSALKKAKDEFGYEFKVGPELEFFFFKMNGGMTTAPEVHDSAGYFDLSPVDLATEIRREVVHALEAMGLRVEMMHHEVAPGQHEIDFRYDNALTIADSVITYKNVMKTLGMKNGLYASFMPKPLYGINGSGMHVHQSLWKDGKNVFFDAVDKYRLSKTAMSYIAGILEHARALAAVVAPTVNSYKRLVPGYEAPAYVCWAAINRSALIRIPRDIAGRESGSRAEVRFPDPSSNPYLAFAAMLGAGLDGVRRNLDPGEPTEEDVYEFSAEDLAQRNIKMLPASLKEAMDELRGDEVVKAAIGKAYASLTALQAKQWDAYRMQVTKWELETYLPVI